MGVGRGVAGPPASLALSLLLLLLPEPSLHPTEPWSRGCRTSGDLSVPASRSWKRLNPRPRSRVEGPSVAEKRRRSCGGGRPMPGGPTRPPESVSEPCEKRGRGRSHPGRPPASRPRVPNSLPSPGGSRGVQCLSLPPPPGSLSARGRYRLQPCSLGNPVASVQQQKR